MILPTRPLLALLVSVTIFQITNGRTIRGPPTGGSILIPGVSSREQETTYTCSLTTLLKDLRNEIRGMSSSSERSYKRDILKLLNDIKNTLTIENSGELIDLGFGKAQLAPTEHVHHFVDSEYEVMNDSGFEIECYPIGESGVTSVEDMLHVMLMDLNKSSKHASSNSLRIVNFVKSISALIARWTGMRYTELFQKISQHSNKYIVGWVLKLLKPSDIYGPVRNKLPQQFKTLLIKYIAVLLQTSETKVRQLLYAQSDFYILTMIKHLINISAYADGIDLEINNYIKKGRTICISIPEEQQIITYEPEVETEIPQVIFATSQGIESKEDLLISKEENLIDTSKIIVDEVSQPTTEYVVLIPQQPEIIHGQGSNVDTVEISDNSDYIEIDNNEFLSEYFPDYVYVEPYSNEIVYVEPTAQTPSFFEVHEGYDKIQTSELENVMVIGQTSTNIPIIAEVQTPEIPQFIEPIPEVPIMSWPSVQVNPIEEIRDSNEISLATIDKDYIEIVPQLEETIDVSVAPVVVPQAPIIVPAPPVIEIPQAPIIRPVEIVDMPAPPALEITEVPIIDKDYIEIVPQLVETVDIVPAPPVVEIPEIPIIEKEYIELIDYPQIVETVTAEIPQVTTIIDYIDYPQSEEIIDVPVPEVVEIPQTPVIVENYIVDVPQPMAPVVPEPEIPRPIEITEIPEMEFITIPPATEIPKPSLEIIEIPQPTEIINIPPPTYITEPPVVYPEIITPPQPTEIIPIPEVEYNYVEIPPPTYIPEPVSYPEIIEPLQPEIIPIPDVEYEYFEIPTPTYIPEPIEYPEIPAPQPEIIPIPDVEYEYYEIPTPTYIPEPIEYPEITAPQPEIIPIPDVEYEYIEIPPPTYIPEPVVYPEIITPPQPTEIIQIPEVDYDYIEIPPPTYIPEPVTYPEIIRPPQPTYIPEPVIYPEIIRPPPPTYIPEPVTYQEIIRPPQPTYIPEPVIYPEIIRPPPPTYIPEPVTYQEIIRPPQPTYIPEPVTYPEIIRPPPPTYIPEPVIYPEIIRQPTIPPPTYIPKPVPYPSFEEFIKIFKPEQHTIEDESVQEVVEIPQPARTEQAIYCVPPNNLPAVVYPHNENKLTKWIHEILQFDQIAKLNDISSSTCGEIVIDCHKFVLTPINKMKLGRVIEILTGQRDISEYDIYNFLIEHKGTAVIEMLYKLIQENNSISTYGSSGEHVVVLKDQLAQLISLLAGMSYETAYELLTTTNVAQLPLFLNKIILLSSSSTGKSVETLFSSCTLLKKLKLMYPNIDMQYLNDLILQTVMRFFDTLNTKISSTSQNMSSEMSTEAFRYASSNYQHNSMYNEADNYWLKHYQKKK